MSARHHPKEKAASYEMLREWDEVLLGDQELFEEMIAPHLAALSVAARGLIAREHRLGNLQPNFLSPEDLVAETLVHAWEIRDTRATRKPLKDWLLEVQGQTLRRMIEEEKRLHGAIALSLSDPVPSEAESMGDENELFHQWVEPPMHDQWQDVITDDSTQPMAA